jgi:hypothetical protein
MTQHTSDQRQELVLAIFKKKYMLFRHVIHYLFAIVFLLIFAPFCAADELSIGNGVVVKFGPEAGMVVSDSLRVAPDVVFTGRNDDSVGASSGSGSGKVMPDADTAAMGDWRGLRLEATANPSAQMLNGLSLRFAGGSARPAGPPLAALMLDGTGYAFTGLSIRDSTVGVLATQVNGAASLSGFRLQNNGVGLLATGGAAPTLNNSTLTGNTRFGVQNLLPSTIVNARSNWWGAANGPLDAVGNPGGTGDAVSSGVDYGQTLAVAPNLTLPGPVITVDFNDAPLLANTTLTTTGVLQVTAQSTYGVQTIGASLDGFTVLSVNGNGAGVGTGTTLLDFASQANGVHVLVITSADVYGNTSQITRSFTLALSSPPVPSITLPATGTSQTQSTVAVSGTASPGASVQLHLNGAPAGGLLPVGLGGNFSTSLSLPAAGTFSLQASAVNGRGASALSTPVTLDFASNVPTVVFTSPGAASSVSGNTPILLAAIDANGVAQVELSLDGNPLRRFTQTPYQLGWDTTTVADGPHTLSATVTNASGQTATATRSVIVQNTPLPPPVVPTDYTGAVDTITPAVSYGTEPVVIQGRAQRRGTGVAMPFAPLSLTLRVNGFERRISVQTDANGAFSFSFTPQPNDAGTYSVAALHPDEPAGASQGQFTINRISFSVNRYTLQAPRGVQSDVVLSASASAGTGVTGLRWVALATKQPSGALPAGITLDGGRGIDIAPGAATPMVIHLTADATALASGAVYLTALATDTGDAVRGTLRLDYQIFPAAPALFADPTYIETGAQQGASVNASTTIGNRGVATATNVQVKLVDAAPANLGGTPPAWVYLSSAGRLGSLAVGARIPVQITANPPAGLADGVYSFALVLSADNDPGGRVPVSVAVTQAGAGGVKFQLVDLYTNTLDAANIPIPGVAGATVKLQNEAVTSQEFTQTSNAQGVATFADLAPGTYRYRASAPRHTDQTGRALVLPGVSKTVRVFLDYPVVNIEFGVTETSIRDEYNITLSATFNTQVPAPVLLLEPLAINLPDMQIGEVVTGVLTLTNYGLVRADELVFTPPESDAHYRYEFMATIPDYLNAKSRISIPYRVTAIQPVSARTLPNGGGLLADNPSNPGLLARMGVVSPKSASCSGYGNGPTAKCSFKCAAGDTSRTSANAVFSRRVGPTCGDDSAAGMAAGGGSSLSSASPIGGGDAIPTPGRTRLKKGCRPKTPNNTACGGEPAGGGE